jgi:hypothetical protein
MPRDLYGVVSIAWIDTTSRTQRIQTMNNTTSRFRLAAGVALIAGMAVLAGCGGPAPYRSTTTSEQSTITTPAVPATSTTTTTQQNFQQRP